MCDTDTYTHTHICIVIHIYTSTHIHTDKTTWAATHVCVCMNHGTCTCMHVVYVYCVYACLCQCVHVRYGYTYTRTRRRTFVTHIYTRTHIHTVRLHVRPLMRVCVRTVAHVHMCLFDGAVTLMCRCAMYIQTQTHCDVHIYTRTHIHTDRLHVRPLTSVFVWIMVHVHMCLFWCMLFTCIACITRVCFNVYMYDIDMYTHRHVHAHLWHTYTHTHFHTETLREWPLMRVCVWIVVRVHVCLFACTWYACIVYGVSVSMYRCVIQIHTRIHTYALWYTYTKVHTSIQTDYMSDRSCARVYELWYMYTCVSLRVCCTRVLCMVRLCQCIDVWYRYRHAYTHMHCDTHIDTYTHPHRQDYMSGHSCVCLYESWYMYTCVSLHACCIRVLRVCVSVSMYTCVI